MSSAAPSLSHSDPARRQPPSWPKSGPQPFGIDLVVLRRLVEAYVKDRRQFSSRSRGRKLARECPICAYRGYFLSVERGLRLDSRCPRCGSRERHRLMHLFLTEGGVWKLDGRRVLHFAPEHYMLKLMQGNELYQTADLRNPLAMHVVNAESIPFAAESFDVIIANHLLEHVPDDRRAMAEFFRVLRPGGFSLISVPQNQCAEQTDEDASVPKGIERYWRFGAFDHRRLYGRDFPRRLSEAGFDVLPYVRPAADVVHHALRQDEILFVATKAQPGG